MPLGIGTERRKVDHRELGHEFGEFVGFRTHQQRTDEEVVPSELVDHPHLDAVLRLRTAVQVRHEQHVLARKRLHEVVIQPVERVRLHRLVGLAPPHRLVTHRVAHDEPVLRSSARVAAGADHERAVLRKQALTAAHRMLDERRGRQIPENLRAGRNPLRFKAATRNPITHVRSHSLVQLIKMRRRPVWAAAAWLCVRRL